MRRPLIGRSARAWWQMSAVLQPLASVLPRCDTPVMQAHSGQSPTEAPGGAMARYGLFAASGLFLAAAVRLYAYDFAAGAMTLLALSLGTALEGATNKREGARATNPIALATLVGLALIAMVWAVLVVG